MDDGMTPRIKCDVELELSGPTEAVIKKWLADSLRVLADRIEQEDFEDGFHSVTDKTGKKIGEVYFDHSESDFG